MQNEIIFLNNIDGSNSSNSLTFLNTLDGGGADTSSFIQTVSGNSSAERLKNKLSALVESQFPGFIPAEYPTFVLFVKYYYKFLEQDFNSQELIQNALSYSDVDRTIPQFVLYFLQQYGKDLPVSSLVDKKLLIKKIKDLYESKGSSLSFKLLFNLLYQTDVTVRYPYENVLIASDGTWFQKVTVRVSPIIGNIDSLTNRLLTYEINNASFQTPIIDAKLLGTDLIEITLDNNRLAPNYVNGDTVYVYNGTGETVFSGTLFETPTEYSVLQGGSGFRVGQIFNINFAGGIDTLVKVTKVSSGGAIQELKFINYGYNYPSFFTAVIDPASVTSRTLDSFASGTGGFSDDLTILVLDASSPNRYFDSVYTENSNYTGNVVLTTTDTDLYGDLTPPSVPGNFALINFTSTCIARYPGSFTTNRGLVSEAEIRLQDDLLYQPFAYQTQSEIDISKFYDTVIKLIHPAGQRLFNNRLFENLIDVSANVRTSNVFIEPIYFEAYDRLDVGEDEFYNLNKLLVDSVDNADNNFYNLSKVVTDDQDLIDNNFFNLNIIISDIVDTVDEIGIQQNVLQDIVNETDSLTTYTINKLTEDTSETVENGVVEFRDYFLEDFTSEDYNAPIFSF